MHVSEADAKPTACLLARMYQDWCTTNGRTSPEWRMIIRADTAVQTDVCNCAFYALATKSC